jgi:hypothetical protein
MTKGRYMIAYFCTGGNGTVLQFADGRFADTVIGDTSEDMEAHDALQEMLEETNSVPEIFWQDSPLSGDFSQKEMEEYVGA